MIKLRDIFSKNNVLDPGALIYRRPSNPWRVIVPIVVLILIGLIVWFFVFSTNVFNDEEDHTEVDLVLKRNPIEVELEQKIVKPEPPVTVVNEIAAPKNDVRDHIEPLDKVLEQYKSQ